MSETLGWGIKLIDNYQITNFLHVPTYIIALHIVLKLEIRALKTAGIKCIEKL